MGLDMYVTGKRYLWSFDGNDDQRIASDILHLFPEMVGKTVKEVAVEVMYWRKANAIHKWFVDNLQEGKDECQETIFNPTDLYPLQELCRTVLEDNSRAAELLPTASGFFFGGSEYDEWYFKDIERTLKWLDGFLIKDALDGALKHWDFYYQSSW